MEAVQKKSENKSCSFLFRTHHHRERSRPQTGSFIAEGKFTHVACYMALLLLELEQQRFFSSFFFFVWRKHMIKLSHTITSLSSNQFMPVIKRCLFYSWRVSLAWRRCDVAWSWRRVWCNSCHGDSIRPAVNYSPNSTFTKISAPSLGRIPCLIKVQRWN